VDLGKQSDHLSARQFFDGGDELWIA